MKKMKRLICLLLVLVSIVATVPMPAAAAKDEVPTAIITVKKKIPSQAVTKYTVEVGNTPVKLSYEKYITIKDKIYEFSHFTRSKETYGSMKVPAYDGTKEWETKWGNTISLVYKRHNHAYKKGFTRNYHWDICECGVTRSKVRHVDPATDADKICICGYQFSNNATLTTLWLDHVLMEPSFSKDITDYSGTVQIYLEPKKTRITTQTFDALATVELPTNLELHEGLNVFQIKVIAEDKTATKLYTVKAVMPIKVEDALIAADGESLTVTPKTTILNLTGSAAMSEVVEQKLVEMLATEKAAKVIFLPQFNKWSIPKAEVILTASQVKAIADKPADLVVKTPYGSSLTIPAADLTALAQKESVSIRIGRDNTFAVMAGEEVLTLSDKVTLALPE